MKRISAGILMALLFALPMLAKSITITSPVAGVTWEIGKHQNITWTYAGMPATTPIRIVLWQNGQKVDNIVVGLTVGLGTYEWPVGSTTSVAAPAGSGYDIRIRTEDNSVIVNSGSFTLSPKPQIKPITVMPIVPFNPTKGIQVNLGKSMNITSPKAGDTADPYNTVYIYWTKLGALDNNVSVTLLRNGAAVATLAASTPTNDGQFIWNPLSLSPDPGPYTIKVKTLDGTCEAVSGVFTMKETGGIELLIPQGGEIYETGTAHDVTWKRQGNIQTLDISLSRGGSTPKILAQGVSAKLQSKSVVFVRDPYDGASVKCYTIDLNSSIVNTIKHSGCFTLTGNPDLAVSATLTMPPVINIGTDITFNVQVTNQGLGVSHACTGDLRFNGAVQSTFNVPAINPGTSATVGVHWAYTGSGTIKITVDTGNANIEPDKSNNSWTHNF